MHKDDGHYPASRLEYVGQADVSLLEGRELFEGVGVEALEGVARHSTIQRLAAQEHLHTVREEVAYIYIILSGYVAVWITSQFTDAEETFLAWRGPEQIIGEMRAVADSAQEARIVTCEPCTLIEMRSDNFTDVAKGSAQIYLNIARLLVKKMEHERCRSEIIRMSSASRQVAQTLLHLAHERCGRDRLHELDGTVIPGVIHQYEVAGYVGVKRETINRELSELKHEDIIDYVKSPNGRLIKILKGEELKQRALGKSDGDSCGDV